MSRSKFSRASLIATASGDEIIDSAIRILEERLVSGDPVKTLADVWQFASLKLCPIEREVLACLFLNNRCCVIAYEELFFGTIDHVSVHARPVVARALQLNAAALILVHNQTSGIPEPSNLDQEMTRRLREALTLIGVQLLDHLIVGNTGYVSLSERGMI